MSRKFETVAGASKVECSIDFVLVVAVPVERDAVLALLEPVDDGGAALKVFEGETVYYVGRLGLYTCALVMCQMGSTGRDSSILATSTAIETWKPAGGVVMPGIASVATLRRRIANHARTRSSSSATSLLRHKWCLMSRHGWASPSTSLAELILSRAFCW